MFRPTAIANTLLVLLLARLRSPPLAAAATDGWCLERGFDPSDLSCDTCALLEESTTLRSLQRKKNDAGEGDLIDIGLECRACCQTHRRNPVLRPDASRRGKYRCALLTYSEHHLEQEQDIKDFLERDMDDVLSLKGEHGFRAVTSENAGGPDQDTLMMSRMMYGGGFGGGFGAGPPKLMLFEKHKEGGWSEEDEGEAGEVIVLRGWKREDLKDMLLTLLPNA